MRILRSWGLCVLTIIAVVIAVHEARAQSYPSPGSAPAAAGYPGIALPAPGAAPAPGYPSPQGAIAPQFAMGPTGGRGWDG